MNEWERDLQKLFSIPTVPRRYEIRPNRTGAIIFCTTCTNKVSDVEHSVLHDLVEEAMAHERTNHHT